MKNFLFYLTVTGKVGILLVALAIYCVFLFGPAWLLDQLFPDNAFSRSVFYFSIGTKSKG